VSENGSTEKKKKNHIGPPPPFQPTDIDLLACCRDLCMLLEHLLRNVEITDIHWSYKVTPAAGLLMQQGINFQLIQLTA